MSNVHKLIVLIASFLCSQCYQLLIRSKCFQVTARKIIYIRFEEQYSLAKLVPVASISHCSFKMKKKKKNVETRLKPRVLSSAILSPQQCSQSPPRSAGSGKDPRIAATPQGRCASSGGSPKQSC